MTDMFGLAMEMHKRVIAAQEQSVDAARKTLKSGDAVLVMQKAVQDATKANMAAWEMWLGLWGWRK
jgi:hypothetical protein